MYPELKLYTDVEKGDRGSKSEKYQLTVLPFCFQEFIKEQVEVSSYLLLKLTAVTQSLLKEPEGISVLNTRDVDLGHLKLILVTVLLILRIKWNVR